VNLKAGHDMFEQLDRELWIVTAGAGEQRSGLVATYVSRVSLVPDLPRVTIALAKHHFTRELIEASGAFAMHLITEEQLDWVWRFGICSGREADKFSGLITSTGASGAPILTDALAAIDCRVEARFDTGDRTIYLTEVLDPHSKRTGKPLTLKRLLEIGPPERLCELKLAMEHDIDLDREAIIEWRRRPA
jgi:flavin reductase (DIM6/NTAB) family NADH-FMN oxidoreductase RutF